MTYTAEQDPSPSQRPSWPSWPSWTGWPARAAAALVVSLVCSCAQPPPPKPIGPAAAARATPAEVERRWLQSWFKDTPVRIAQADEDSVTVEVPLGFCFDRGRAAVKPPLGAVLDKLAESLRRNPQARLLLLAAPGDEAADAALALQRASQVRSYLRARGVPDSRLGSASRTTLAAVQLRLRL